QSFEGQKVSAFLGVPYGRRPLGILRFAKPKMARWNGELQARTPAKTCMLTPDAMFPQFRGAEMWNPPNNISEDCLYMNIWVPANPDGSVLVWIFGGGFFSGSPSLDLYNGTALAAKEHTIVVNINYRLGPFGFFYLGDDSPVPGNMGLLDQQLALRWIHENIDSFGGDPKRVTLFGESAGAASATAHMFAPGSYQYFNKIIANSGTIMNIWATQTPDAMLKLSLELAKRLNCTLKGENTSAIHDCLTKVPASAIQDEADILFGGCLPMTFAFVPIRADKNFFKGDVFERLRSRNFTKDVSILIGTVKDEGTFWLPYYLYEHGFGFNHTISAEDEQNKALITEDQYRSSMQQFMPYFGSSPLVERLLRAYQSVTKSETRRERLRDGVGRFIGDYFFTCSLINFTNIIADSVDGVYMYYFTMRSTANPWPKWMGVMHGYEIEYAFGQPLTNSSLYDDKSYLEIEKQFSEYIMKLWTDFANTGIPTSDWPKYDAKKKEVFVLGEKSVAGERHIVTDVPGAQCKLINKAVRGRGNSHDLQHCSPYAQRQPTESDSSDS
ncbi:Carboxylic ester hydrolase, partial [Trichostrongylus colubriformis]